MISTPYGISLQRFQQLQIGLAGRGYQTAIGHVCDRDEPDMPVLAVEQTARQRLINVLKPMAADDVRISGGRAQIGRIGRSALLLGRDIGQPRPK
jgi:hypothetical protein